MAAPAGGTVTSSGVTTSGSSAGGSPSTGAGFGIAEVGGCGWSSTGASGGTGWTISPVSP